MLTTQYSSISHDHGQFQKNLNIHDKKVYKRYRIFIMFLPINGISPILETIGSLMNKVPGCTDRGNTKVSLIPKIKYLARYIYKCQISQELVISWLFQATSIKCLDKKTKGKITSL